MSSTHFSNKTLHYFSFLTAFLTVVETNVCTLSKTGRRSQYEYLEIAEGANKKWYVTG